MSLILPDAGFQSTRSMSEYGSKLTQDKQGKIQFNMSVFKGVTKQNDIMG
jgi:hypothetical protein